MSFLFDLPALFVIGALLYILGNHFNLKRLSKITIGIIIVSCFIIFSVMLYFDMFLNFINNFTSAISYPQYDSSSDFMFKWPIYNSFNKGNVPSLVVIFLFLLYPVSIYLGYACALLISKKFIYRKISKELKSYKDVTSRKDLPENMKFSIVRYSDEKNGISGLSDAVDKTIRELGGISKFVHKNNTVLIKVNICGGIPENQGTYTSKDLVGYVVDLIAKEAGGNTIIVCDADMIWTKFSENAEAIGWNKWVKEKNLELEERYNGEPGTLSKVKLMNLSETELAYFDFRPDSVFPLDEERSNQEIVSTEMLNADVIISIPKMKTHLLTGVTLGMKNMYGTFPEEDKARFHQLGINDVIYWVNYAFPPNLTIIDGIIGGEAIGPLSANPIKGYNTLISSESAPIADAIASKLIGYNAPFENITHLKLTREKELSKPVDQMVLLSGIIPDDLERSAIDLIKDRHLPENPKDGGWERPEEEVANNYEYLMENILAIPGIDTFFNIGADFLLFDMARIPILKNFNKAILDFLYNAPRFWSSRTVETNLARRDRQINTLIFHLVAIFSLYFFVTNYKTRLLSHPDLSQWMIVGFALSIVLFALITVSLRMKTKNLIGITIASMVVAFFVESHAPLVNWWNYYPFDPRPSSFPLFGYNIYYPQYFPFFSIPIFIVIIISISYFIFKPILAYVDLKGERFKMVPFGAVTILLALLISLEGYLNGSVYSEHMIEIYLLLGIIGWYYNQKKSLEWNLSIAIVAIILGGTMEYLGFIAGLWGYPGDPFLSTSAPFPLFVILNPGFIVGLWGYHESTSTFPLFVSLTWALNTWAACGMTQIFGIDMSRAFPLNEKDKKKNEELAKAKNKADLVDGGKMVKNSVESIFGVNAGVIWKALNKKNGPMTIDDLIKVTYLKREEIYGALGWLGRENKISVETCGNVRYFSLRP